MPQTPELKDTAPSTSSTSPTPAEAPAESRLDEALAEYMERSDLGETVDRAAFLEKYNDIRGELAAFFRMADQLADAQLGKLLEGRKAPSLSETLAAVSPLALPSAPEEPASTPLPAVPLAKPVAPPKAEAAATAGKGAAVKAKDARDKNAPQDSKDTGSKDPGNKDGGKDTEGKDGEGDKKKAKKKRPRDRVESARERIGWGPWISDRFRETPGAAVSAGIHALILLLLGLMSLPLPELDQLSIPILVEQIDDKDQPAIEPITEIVQQEEQTEDTEVVEALTQVSEAMDISSLNDAPAPALRTDLSDFSNMHTMSLDSLVASSAKKGDGLGAGGMGKVKFFGQSTSGQRFVFVIDNSNSMGKGKFETALYELELAVEQMTPRQSFYVVFFSDTAYPLFHPEPAYSFVPATSQNKAKLREWLKTVEMCLRTDALDAVQKAISLNPDVIYLLGDGAFTDKTGTFLAGLPSGPQIHVLGMDVREKDAISFKAISDKFKGTYKDVGIHPDQAQVAKANPRPKNNKRGSVWGLKLPDK